MTQASDLHYCTELVVLRNYQDIPFDSAENKDHARMVVERFEALFENAFEKLDVFALDDETEYIIATKSSLAINSLKKSPELSVYYNGEFIVILNHYEHIQIHALVKQMDVMETYSKIEQLLEELDHKHVFARNAKGYVNSKKSFFGTGVFIHEFLHLPMLQFFDKLEENLLSKFHLELKRGSHEDGNPISTMLRFSTSDTNFVSFEEQYRYQSKRRNQLLQKEIDEQENVMKNSLLSVLDKVHKAYGVASHAKLLDEMEFLSLHAFFRTASECGVLKVPCRILDAVFEEIFRSTYSIFGFEEASVLRAKLVKRDLIPLIFDKLED